MPSSKPVLVTTGASGFVALHTIIQLVQKGHIVRATLRTLSREAEVREAVGKHVEIKDNLEIVGADLTQDSSWDKVVEGCEAVLHIASPFPMLEPKDENELVLPATLRVLRAAYNANIKRVIIVLSIAAVSSGYNGENRTFDENNWSDVEKDIGASAKSKTLAELAARDFINSAEKTNKMELVAINPPLILGPLPNKDLATSAEMVSTSCWDKSQAWLG